jgi:hypothetical protein
MLLLLKGNMRTLFLTLAMFASLNINTFAQSSRAPEIVHQDPIVTSKQIENLPVARVKPRITLQRALKIAGNYAKKEKINLSSYFLLEARMIRYGGPNNVKEVRWVFRWANENSSTGDNLEITVSMDGKPTRLPSM